MPRILIIEDDARLGKTLERNLKAEGYDAELAIDGRLGMSAALAGTADLIVLDLMLPYINGLQILKQMRKELINTPVIILTAKIEEAERLEGFRAGCDDYVTKPFSLLELIARIKATLRRSGFREIPSVVNSGGLVVDPGSRTAKLNKMPVIVSPKEFELLYLLASHPNQALSRHYLLDEIWGEDTDVTTRTVDSHISCLRRKLEQDPDNPTKIVTVYKLGYMWKTRE